MLVSLIAALTQNRVIGRNNGLPWNLPDDMKYFMNTTKTHHVISGRKNYETIPEKFRPLPNRINIVVTRQKNYNALDSLVVHSLEAAIELARKAGETEAFIIGGAEIYKMALPLTQRMYLTEIQTALPGDVTFPEYNRSEWKEVSRKQHPADNRHQYAFDFVIYDRI